MQSVTACIVSYNNGRQVEKAVESLLLSKLPATVYISDNNSKDDTVEYLKRKFPEKTHPNVILIENRQNNGFGAGQNVVLGRLDSEYHIVVNPDIVVPENTLDEMAEYMDKNPDVSLLSPRILYPNGEEQILPKSNPSVHRLISRRCPILKKSRIRYEMRDKDLTVPQEINFATGCFMFLRTEQFKEIGGFDERYFMYFEDADLTLRLKKYGKVLYEPSFVVYHGWNRKSAKSIKYLMIQIGSMFKFFKKWGWRF